MNSNFCLDLDTHYYNCSGNEGRRRGSHLVPLTKPAVGLTSPPGSALRRAGKRRTAVQNLRPGSGHGAFSFAIVYFKTY